MLPQQFFTIVNKVFDDFTKHKYELKFNANEVLKYVSFFSIEDSDAFSVYGRCICFDLDFITIRFSPILLFLNNNNTNHVDFICKVIAHELVHAIIFYTDREESDSHGAVFSEVANQVKDLIGYDASLTVPNEIHSFTHNFIDTYIIN